ncbi:MAG: hypothetical protein IJI67_04230 [Clostridia bacterium]|nr:hypothetical protein [Clostridia bacterium]
MSKKKNYKECNTTPFETGIRGFQNIAKYYMYYAPNIDSAQSQTCLSDSDADKLFDKMVKQTGLKQKVKVIKRVQKTSFNDFSLNEEKMDFENSCMVIDRYKNENKLHALLRHIRNAFAHGNIYVWRKKKGNYIFFVDYDKSKNKDTARIMVSENILKLWKAIIEEQLEIEKKTLEEKQESDLLTVH